VEPEVTQPPLGSTPEDLKPSTWKEESTNGKNKMGKASNQHRMKGQLKRIRKVVKFIDFYLWTIAMNQLIYRYEFIRKANNKKSDK